MICLKLSGSTMVWLKLSRSVDMSEVVREHNGMAEGVKECR